MSHIKEPARIKLKWLRISTWMSVNIPCIHKDACFGSYDVASNSTIRYGLVRQKKWSCRMETESFFHHSLVEIFKLWYIAFLRYSTASDYILQFFLCLLHRCRMPQELHHTHSMSCSIQLGNHKQKYRKRLAGNPFFSFINWECRSSS